MFQLFVESLFAAGAELELLPPESPDELLLSLDAALLSPEPLLSDEALPSEELLLSDELDPLDAEEPLRE
jgi:hypothetical protein